jgi:hypothetical protein
MYPILNLGTVQNVPYVLWEVTALNIPFQNIPVDGMGMIWDGIWHQGSDMGWHCNYIIDAKLSSRRFKAEDGLSCLDQPSFGTRRLCKST